MKLVHIGALTFAVMLSTVGWSQTIYKNSGYQWKEKEIIQGKFSGRALSPTKVVSNYVPIPPKMEVWNDMNPKEINRREWNLSANISHLPHYESSNVLDNALYNMALEESVLAIEPDSTFRTGIAWGGVWTRDVSYSIIHSLAQLHPEVSMKSLRAKVTRNNRIVQDTGTGGAWPCSTDRVIWAVAAWEVYKVTGDRQWLSYIYPIIRNTVMDDRIVAYDHQTHLMRGETSYMDWREQEYPQWMEPADIYMSESTVNNAVHYMAVMALADVCAELGHKNEAERWRAYAATISEGMNKHLWLEDKGYYSIYLYGHRHMILSEQCDAMGSALTILSGIADSERARILSEHQVSEPFGTPCIYPNLRDQYPYHNDATWPFVQGYWMRACAKVGNEPALLHSIGALYRGAALWLSNEENYEISTGDYQLTKLNSPRQLWSVAAQAAVVPHVYFGIEYLADRIEFHPFVPKPLAGRRSLSDFKYRNACLDISMEGYGREIAEFRLDGELTQPQVLGTLQGKHKVEIKLANRQPEKMNMTLCENAYLPLTPASTMNNGKLTWNPIEGVAKYEIIRNGKVVATTTETAYDCTENGEYAVRSVSADGTRGYMSRPHDYYDNTRTYVVNPGSYLDLTRKENIYVQVAIDIKEEGDYSLDWRYSNGSGPINTNNKCATRIMRVSGMRRPLPVVFPQRGDGEWENWGYSNMHVVHLKPGTHIVSLEFGDAVENMHFDDNFAHLESLRCQKID